VWRVVPLGDLTIIAGGPSELETLRYSRAERRLRLDLGVPRSDWNQGGDTRFRLLDGTLSVGAETIAGPVLEMLRVETTAEDGWPSPQEFDTVFLISGDSLRLVIAGGPDASELSYGWLWTPVEEQAWDSSEIRWIEMRPLQEARRDVPWVWGFQIDAAGLTGEIEAIGSDALLGPERGGRRAVEIRSSVSGWVEIDGVSWPVTGMIHHAQH
jgi:hypothetical protein